MEIAPRLILEIPTVSFHSEQELADYVLELPPNVFLYRGQSREYRRRWPLFNAAFRPLSSDDLIDLRCWKFEPPETRLPIQLLPGTLDLPSLIPTNTRAYERFVTGTAAGPDESAFEDMMVYFWTTVSLFIVGLACRLLADEQALAWLAQQWTKDFPRLYKLRSIAQHYGMDTGLLDASSSFQVALWFATHDFASGHYRSNSSGVVYLINRDCLIETERWIESIPEHEGEFDARTIDICDTPASVAPRASRQCGWSLVGWDHPRLIIAMTARGGLVRHAFPTSDKASLPNSLTRDWLVPSKTSDPVRALFEHFWKRQPQSIAEAQLWLDEHWNPIATNRILIDEAGNWFDQVSSQFGRILDYHEKRFNDSFK
jgi:FRG domain